MHAHRHKIPQTYYLSHILFCMLRTPIFICKFSARKKKVNYLVVQCVSSILTLPFPGCCLDLFMGYQQLALCVCGITGTIPCFIYCSNPCLWILRFCVCFSYYCRMAQFSCLICAKLQDLWNSSRDWQATLFIPYILFHPIQIFVLVLGQSYLPLRLACASGTLKVLTKGKYLIVYSLCESCLIHWYIVTYVYLISLLMWFIPFSSCCHIFFTFSPDLSELFVLRINMYKKSRSWEIISIYTF